ncbi:alcohol dehydrogenase family protein [Sulfitobacter aestuariivivens]|uniref:Alcohol dehydrogenase family protein n=1 Tax=Sulfitobacter aestuariivivens TaxID=2766981 RepID=A0A927HDL5_9RHOB|nr:alcohol dehydrogenase family protein [Sulfitobacter aestuariivivens]MBD3662424.1 alcohol dehydrogenase family protein [Sulfitobacter aestuariivivens]
MSAVVLHAHGGMEALQYHTDWPVPKPGHRQVLIRVGACGLNNTDVNTRTGWYSKAVTGGTDSNAGAAADDADPAWGGAPVGLPRIQGADAVGLVVAAGAEADPSLVGKRVMIDCWMRNWDDPLNRETTGYFGSEIDGGFAQYTVVDHRNVAAVDSPLSDAELATFSCSYSTAEGMLWRAGVHADDRVLITGASGGVGSALVQLAKRRGAFVIALASPAKHEVLRDLGADLVLERAPADLPVALKENTGHDKVTVVADVVGGDYWPHLIDTLVRGGRYVTSGAIAGPIVALDLRTLYLQDLTLHGSTVIPPQIFADLVGYIERGEVRPLLAATYPLQDLKQAQTAFIEKRHVGNIVVVPELPVEPE